ncbi:toxic anion resistance protein [Diplocloster agilis]|uniref:Toxic anion resistance protein n=1 Tax=Diplocloster agilis TaxID=2850323 RepID=A0A949K8Y5_9FIRM|nr:MULTISPECIES: toxic anion resistance protein [Lachnospiraceae]MBU9738937.1 toxic anion resistance protein [Diplocloster agilis]MBU9743776.1 toxic anion resistance protein [Diplocloster agilis]MCU6733984.1 toxic anion resistance protein [Suonthocola fibrivorans]SCJ18358.1 TelA-like protein SA1238 [uncultured Clostridium sp.]
MSDTLKEMPSFTLELDTDPIPAAPPVVKQEAKEEPVPAGVEDMPLNEQEQKMVEDFIPKIDLNNSNMILQYGSGAQKKIADFSQNVLNNVRTKDLGEIGEMLSGVVNELKSFDVEEEKGLFGIFKRSSNKMAAMKSKYDKAEVNINKICDVLEQHQKNLLKDTAMLDQMYELNTVYFKELSLYIIAGKKKLKQVHDVDLANLLDQASRSGLPEDAQAANDLANLCDRFEKKLHDLELTRMISIQMAPQIRLVQNNDTLMSDKIQSTLVNTIPLWKSQMVLALGVENSRQAAAAQREVTEMTNALLRKNADTLKTATIDIAKESERGIVDIETLQHTNESLITTLDEVMRIQEEGRQKRREAEKELARLEGELKQKLLGMRG